MSSPDAVSPSSSPFTSSAPSACRPDRCATRSRRCRCGFRLSWDFSAGRWRSGDRPRGLAGQSVRSADDRRRLWLSAAAAGRHGHGRRRPRRRGGLRRQTSEGGRTDVGAVPATRLAERIKTNAPWLTGCSFAEPPPGPHPRSLTARPGESKIASTQRALDRADGWSRAAPAGML